MDAMIHIDEHLIISLRSDVMSVHECACTHAAEADARRKQTFSLQSLSGYAISARLLM